MRRGGRVRKRGGEEAVWRVCKRTGGYVFFPAAVEVANEVGVNGERQRPAGKGFWRREIPTPLGDRGRGARSFCVDGYWKRWISPWATLATMVSAAEPPRIGQKGIALAHWLATKNSAKSDYD